MSGDSTPLRRRASDRDDTSTLTQVLERSASALVARCSDLGLALILVRSGGAILDANDNALELLGRPIGGLRALPDVSAVLAPDERYRWAEHRSQIRRRLTISGAIDTTIVRNDGQRVPVEAVVVPIDGADLTVVALRDMSDLATSERMIDWYRTLVERMPVGVMLVQACQTSAGPRLRLWAANDAASTAYGRDLTVRIGETVAEIFPDQVNSDDRRRVLALVGTGRAERFPDIVIGDPGDPEHVYRRIVVSLPEDGIGMLLDDVTGERRDELHRRSLLARIVELSDAERRTIALGIHDEPVQLIAGAALLVAQMRRQDAVRTDWLAEVDAALHRSMDSLRRLVFELSPPELVESGLPTALSRVVEHLFANSPVTVRIDCPHEVAVPHAVADTAFRVVTEALTNARKHAAARSIEVRVVLTLDSLVVTIVDDGAGFTDAPPLGHLGLDSMRDRSDAIGGSCEITSGPSGTSVRAALPLDSNRGARSDDYAVTTIAALETARVELEHERNMLRTANEESSRAALAARERLRQVVGLNECLRTVAPDATARALAACRHVTGAWADGCAVRIADGDNVLRRIASWHPDGARLEFLDQWVFVERLPGTSYSSTVFESGQAALIQSSVASWLGADRPSPSSAALEPRSAIIAPLVTGGLIVGVVTLVRDADHTDFDVDDVELAEAVAAIIGAHLPGISV